MLTTVTSETTRIDQGHLTPFADRLDQSLVSCVGAG